MKMIHELHSLRQNITEGIQIYNWFSLRYPVKKHLWYSIICSSLCWCSNCSAARCWISWHSVSPIGTPGTGSGEVSDLPEDSTPLVPKMRVNHPCFFTMVFVRCSAGGRDYTFWYRPWGWIENQIYPTRLAFLDVENEYLSVYLSIYLSINYLWSKVFAEWWNHRKWPWFSDM